MAGKHIIILGPPGSGKGTQAVRIAEKLSVRHLSTGDLLREAVAGGTDLGSKAKAFMDRGLLVPDELMLGLIREQLTGNDEANGNGWILDGFPRTLPQAEALTGMLDEIGVEVDHILSIDVDPQVIVKRVGGRRVCEDCMAVYNIASLDGGEGASCEKCGGRLIKRADDEEATILRRFEVYKDQTEPVIEYYRSRVDEIVAVDGSGDIDGITAEIISALR
ncbi:MAG TPA: adenylate kinase [Candidatus Krumholzibacterium sp.]|nr:adenylate kinase [Candidatus Krumholzibacterium sp.]